MSRDGSSQAASKVSPTAPPVLLGIAVQYFFPEAAGGHADPVIQAGNRGKVTDHQNLIIGGASLAQVRDNTVIGVFKIDPFKTVRGKIFFV
jgi:hypothetical protein